MGFSDSFFNRIEKKTSVDKNTILELAKQKGLDKVFVNMFMKLLEYVAQI